MPEEKPLQRQWLLLRALVARRYPMTVQDMVAETGSSPKTIRRDLDLFRTIGVPLEESIGPHGRKAYLVRNDPGVPLTLSYDELLALSVGKRLLEPMTGTMFWESVDSAFRKLRASVSKTVLDYVERAGKGIHGIGQGAVGYESKGDIIDVLMQGVEEHQSVHIVYRGLSATEPAERTVYPYGLAYHHGWLYLVAYSPDHRQIRHYKVDRMEEASVSGVPFQVLDDFDLARHFANSFGVFAGDASLTARIQFSAKVARYIAEKRWHSSQQLEHRPDGSVIATFRLSSLEELKGWVLGFGSNAVVLGPRALRNQVRRELRQAAAAYGSASAASGGKARR